MIFEDICKGIFGFVKRIGTKNFFLGVGIIVICFGIISFLWKLEKNVAVKPILDSGNIVEEEKKIEVIRMTKAGDGFSAISFTTDFISGISSETETINAFNELVSACKDSSKKKQTILIPQGAGFTDFGGIGIYTWVKTGRHLLTGSDFSEMQAIIFFEGQYASISFHAKLSSISMGVDIETGTY